MLPDLKYYIWCLIAQEGVNWELSVSLIVQSGVSFEPMFCVINFKGASVGIFFLLDCNWYFNESSLYNAQIFIDRKAERYSTW